MPRSRFVSAERLRPLIVYMAVAFVVLLLADGVARELFGGGMARRAVAGSWVVLFPLGGWLVWRRG